MDGPFLRLRPTSHRAAMPFTKNKSKETREEYLARKKLERQRAAELRKRLLKERLQRLKANPLFQRRYERDITLAPLALEDLDLIKELSMYHADEATIAHSLNFYYGNPNGPPKFNEHLSWLNAKKEFPIIQKTIDEGRAAGKAILYRLQFQGALEGNTTLLMYLGRYVLGYGQNEVSVPAMQQSTALELSEEAKLHLAELAQAITEAARAEPKPASAQVVEAESETNIVKFNCTSNSN